MTPTPPELFKVESDRPAPIDWTAYSFAISVTFNLRLKWSIARNLLELTRLHSNPADCPPFARLWKDVQPRETIVRQQMFAMQTIAVTMDLTENFAAMCFAYAEAVANGPKFLPLLLRDFGKVKTLRKRYRGSNVNSDLGAATVLFEEMLNSGDVLKKYLACQEEPNHTVLAKRKVISEIVKFRNKYEAWYNKFKHTYSVLPFEYVFDVPGGLSVLHRIPDHLNWSDQKVTFREDRLLGSIVTDESVFLGTRVSHMQTDSFLTAYQNLDDVAQILALLEQFWQTVRAAQHKSLFGAEPPV